MNYQDETNQNMLLDRLSRLRAVAHEMREGGCAGPDDLWMLKCAERGAFATLADCRDAGCGPQALAMLQIGGKA